MTTDPFQQAANEICDAYCNSMAWRNEIAQIIRDKFAGVVEERLGTSSNPLAIRLRQLQHDLVVERNARESAERERDSLQVLRAKWSDDLAECQRSAVLLEARRDENQKMWEHWQNVAIAAQGDAQEAEKAAKTNKNAFELAIKQRDEAEARAKVLREALEWAMAQANAYAASNDLWNDPDFKADYEKAMLPISEEQSVLKD